MSKYDGLDLLTKLRLQIRDLEQRVSKIEQTHKMGAYIGRLEEKSKTESP